VVLEHVVEDEEIEFPTHEAGNVKQRPEWQTGQDVDLYLVRQLVPRTRFAVVRLFEVFSVNHHTKNWKERKNERIVKEKSLQQERGGLRILSSSETENVFNDTELSSYSDNEHLTSLSLSLRERHTY
jgi:hypothetical protein